MFDLQCNKTDTALTVFLNGRIDSANAADVEKAITQAVAGFSGELILDAAKLDYISSAGLRVILRLKKLNKTTRICNVSSDVY